MNFINTINDIKTRIKFVLRKNRNFPTNIGINLTSGCNSRCGFCTYEDRLSTANFLRTDYIKTWAWLSKIPNIALWSGVGDSLLHPEFELISETVKEIAPRSRQTLFTNGIALRTLPYIDEINVSLNAATAEIWAKITGRSASLFDHVCKKIKDADNVMSLSFVACRKNIIDLPSFIILADTLNVKTVNVCHYLPTVWAGERLYSVNQSLYRHKDLYNRKIEAAQKISEILEIQLNAPAPFGTPRAQKKYCFEPWTNLYLTASEEGKREVIPCCSGVYFGIPWNPDNIDIDKIWNHPTLKHLRMTVNNPIGGGNMLCRWCKSTDRFNPDSAYSYNGLKDKVKKGEWLT